MKQVYCHIVLLFTLVSGYSSAQYLGGDNDGYSSDYICSTDLNGTTSGPLSISAISGPSLFCNNNTEEYIISVTAGAATSYSWSLPTGASIDAGGNNGYVKILFGTSSGNITVTASNGCGENDIEVLAVSNVACSMFSGGDDDGYSSDYICAADLNGTNTGPLAISAISGPASFCNNNAEEYTISVTAGAATSYSWSLPSGASIDAGGSNGYIKILFGTSSGNITVAASNGCGENDSEVLAVSNVACNMFFGGDNDGYSSDYECGTDLNGTTSGPLTISPISGPASFCNNNIEEYTINITGGTATSYSWSLPSGASIYSGGGSGYAKVLFGTSSGNIMVTASNGCGENDTKVMAVSNIACSMFFGGNNDGFAMQPSCETDLNGSAVALAPFVSYTVSCPGAGGTILTLQPSGGYSFDYQETSAGAFSYVGTYTNTAVQKTVPNGGTYDIEIQDAAGCTDDIFGIVADATPSNIPAASIAGTCQVPGTNSWMYIIDASGNAIIAIDDNGTDLGNVSANVYIDGSVGTHNNMSYLQRHYNVVTDNPPGGSGANVRLYFTATELSNLITASAATPYGDDDVFAIGDLGTTKYDGPTADGVYDPSDATSLIFIPQASNGSQFGNNYIEFNTPDFSEFWQHGSSSSTPLPVELLFFSGDDKDNYNFLEWATATEINNDYFMVERSFNGISFEPIGFVKGAGNSSSENYYSYKDFSPHSPVSYYRLKQFDFNRTYAYSNTIAVERKNKIVNIVIYPTLLKGNDNLIIKTNTQDKGILKIELTDMLGKCVYYQELNITEGSSSLSLSLPGLPAGIYTVSVAKNGVSKKEKVTVY